MMLILQLIFCFLVNLEMAPRVKGANITHFFQKAVFFPPLHDAKNVLNENQGDIFFICMLFAKQAK